MKKYKGSYTLEAACIFPLALFCICAAIWSGISLCEEVRLKAIKQEENASVDMIKSMYKRELIRDMVGEWYED